MNWKSNFFILSVLFSIAAFPQIPVEIFGGTKKATVDILFFKYFKNKNKSNSKFLFFNRNRVSIDYKMNKTTNLPQFGFTEAISFNNIKFKSFAPVIVLSILNKGISPKIGIQYVKSSNDFTLFGWTVVEIVKNPYIDLFILARFTPKISDKLNLYTQVETINNIPASGINKFNFVQRIRLGVKCSQFQLGFGIDLIESGKSSFTHTQNIGSFLRYEF